MNASVESISPQSRSRARRGVAARGYPDAVQEGIFELPAPFPLHHGGVLSHVRLAWRLVGPAGAPVVGALGGISADRRVCLTAEPRHGWWSEIAGIGRPLDAGRFRILSFDYLGGSGESTAPAPGESFPTVSSYDQAELLSRLMTHLDVGSLHAIAGGSYGGMVALAFGERYPERVGHLLIIGASDRAHPLATGWRSVQRRMVRFALECGRGTEGLELARALAMTTYRSAEEFAARFNGEPQFEPAGARFPIEGYLFARGGEYARRYRAESFLCLSESIDLHRVAAERIFVPATVVAVREDQLVPLADVRGMTARLRVASLHVISSIFGHDAFLKETEQLRRIFCLALGSAS